MFRPSTSDVGGTTLGISSGSPKPGVINFNDTDNWIDGSAVPFLSTVTFDPLEKWN